MPTDGTVPVGEYKVVYEYANGFQARGHEVTITHPFCLQPSQVRNTLTHLRPWPPSSALGFAAFHAHDLVQVG